MGREIKRVALDFDWPQGRTWEGFLRPEILHELPCPSCDYDRPASVLDQLFPVASHCTGYSPHANRLHQLWYGYVPFDPASTGSARLTPETPAVRAYAERNVASAPDYYGTGEKAIWREGYRLAALWNGQWGHHITQDDVAALVAAGRLVDLTHTWTKGEGWQKKDPPVTPTAAEVNEWSLHGFGHDSINASVVIRARCEREGFPVECATCQGHASLEAYEGQRAESDAWERTEPPAGEGWQLWETVTEGSPVSPVFTDAGGLVAWLSDEDRGDDWLTPEAAAEFVAEGWAPTFVSSAELGGMVSGMEAVGRNWGDQS